MAKGTVYYCSECGYKSVKWAGKCPQCGAWSSFEEVDELPKDVKKSKNSDIKVYEFKDVEYTSEDRYKTKYEEFDRLLGGGLLKGEVVLTEPQQKKLLSVYQNKGGNIAISVGNISTKENNIDCANFISQIKAIGNLQVRTKRY